ncbi:hypothetical protein [Sutcliffiella horikoshii]|uniref:hypothetical protein n=1 Tax=Sutcliffiella horikoshii TaxID=79883 RepID=UPI001CFD59E8|nr:hypothetical protein [Sutcliffiella horikoshii]
MPVTDVDSEIINQFTCKFDKYGEGQEELLNDHTKIDYFLKEEALSHHLNQFVRTYLLVSDQEDKVIGFFSLYNEEIAISNGQKKRFTFKGVTIYKSMEVEVYPAIRLHQFAINKDFQGVNFIDNQKYSDYLMGTVFETVRQVAEKSGCMFIGLEATDNSVGFYEGYEFKTLKKKNGKILPYLIFKVADLLIEDLG